MILKKETAVAYRCPGCGSFVTSMVGIFSLSADMVRLKCPCGASQMDIEYTKNGKINMTIPCIMCPSPHKITISSDSFFEKELFEIPCSFTGMNIAFIGKLNRVENAEKEADRILLEALGDNQISNTNEKNELFDPQITEVILGVLHDLYEDKSIECSCGICDECDVEVSEKSITVKCKICGDSLEIPTVSTLKCYDFIETDKIKLNKTK